MHNRLTGKVKLPKISKDGGFFVDGESYSVESVHEDGIQRVGSIPELLKVLQLVRGVSEREVWFRGHKHWSWKLEPTFYRNTEISSHPSTSDISMRETELLHGDLDSLLNTVMQALERVGQRSVNESDALLIAQHYGVKTPLLDWSTNPLIAVWFAIQKHMELKEEDPPTLWLLDPQQANLNVPYRMSEKLTNSPGIDFGLILEVLKREGSSLTKSIITRDFPLAVFSPNDFTTRIGRQSGKFTFSGPEIAFRNVQTGSLTSGDKGQRAFAPILLDPKRAEEMLRELRIFGICAENVYGPRTLDEEFKNSLIGAGLDPDGKPRAESPRVS